MADPTYHIIFSGLVLPGRDPLQVRERLGQMFKLGPAQLDVLFSGTQVPIKKHLDLETATKYRTAFQQAGALVELRRSDLFQPAAQTATAVTEEQPQAEPDRPAADPTPTEEPESQGEDFTLLPPNTGSLIDCAKPVIPAPVPDTAWIHLAPLGSRLAEEGKEAPPPEVDLRSLSLLPPRTGSLEDCRPAPRPISIPDISHLDFLPSEPVVHKEAEF